MKEYGGINRTGVGRTMKLCCPCGYRNKVTIRLRQTACEVKEIWRIQSLRGQSFSPIIFPYRSLPFVHNLEPDDRSETKVGRI